MVDPTTVKSARSPIFTPSVVDAETEAMRKQIRVENKFHVSDKKLDSFINAVKEETKRLRPEKLKLSAEGDTPSLSYHRLNDESVRLILEKFEHKFEPHELQWLKGFVLEHNNRDEVMTLIVKKKFSIKPEVSIATPVQRGSTAKDFAKTFFNKGLSADVQRGGLAEKGAENI